MSDKDIRKTDDQHRDANRDPITGAPGSHPIGTGVGAGLGGAGAAAAGFAIGAAASGPAAPIGGAIGAVVGAIAGGLAGKGVAESVNPTEEDAYWRNEHKNRPYYESGRTYDEYAPAYRYGWESRSKHQGRQFDEVESDLGRDWDRAKGKSSLGWDKAKHATRDAWHRVERAIPGDADRDGR
ncbi:MAG: FIG00348944: hypothetical protein [uncultured Phycisphaerae bacterium]|uniref:Glycine zipper domain-containing protein n=1 Tax=uncultured Phycisphaerae bacterium TaxID=904963 RepID=A0A6J4QD65_9BACT|nr:MAG: FIG00348944: hypothetical protein [uncultured Phycisphaerae bacterium]